MHPSACLLSHCTLLSLTLCVLTRLPSQVGADIKSWFAALPRPQRSAPQKRPAQLMSSSALNAAPGPLHAPSSVVGGGSGTVGQSVGGEQSVTLPVSHGTALVHASKIPAPWLLGAGTLGGGASSTIDAYYMSRSCAVCGEMTQRSLSPLCDTCRCVCVGGEGKGGAGVCVGDEICM